MKKFFAKSIALVERMWHSISCSLPWLEISISFLIATGVFSVFCHLWEISHSPLGLADESFYYYLIKNQEASYGTSFTFYFNAIKDFSIAQMRLVSYILRMTSWCLFNLSICYLFRKRLSKRDLLLVLLAGIAYCSRTGIGFPSYITLSIFWGIVSIASFVFILSSSGLLNIIASLVCGICCIQLLFDMLPSVPLIGIVFISVLIASRKSLPWLVGGYILGLIAFFTLVQSPSDFYSSFIKTYYETRGADNHGVMLLILWSFETMELIFYRSFLPILALIAVLRCGKTSKFQQSFFLLFLIIPIGLRILFDLYRSYKSTAYPFGVDLIYLSFFFVIFFYHEWSKEFSFNEIIIVIVLSLSPIMLSFGTDVKFETRGEVFINLVFFLTLLMVKTINKPNLNFLFSLLIFLCLLGYFLSFFAISWASGSRFFSHTESLEDYGLDVTATPSQLNLIKNIDDYAHNKKYIVGGHDIWHIIVVLKKEPLSPVFRYAKKDLRDIFKEKSIKKDEIVFMEYTDLTEESSSNFAGWIDKYKEYFQAETIKRIAVSPEANLVVFE